MSRRRQLPYVLPSAPQGETEWLMTTIGEYEQPKFGHRDAVNDLLVELSERHQECLRTIWFERATYQQLADRLGVSRPHAWRLTRQAEEKLKALLADHPACVRYFPVDNV